ncbi:MAG: AAC(3) family N-acetyltransferase [Clostridia bacterium]|nr:AAC(3) family N-acetyltransferase [Clostridia bacterium]
MEKIMYTKQDLINDLKKMGLKETDTVLVHSSYKSIAGDVGVDGGADTIVDAFIEYFGEKGLVVFPTMSWKMGWMINDKGEYRPPFDENLDGFYPYGSDYDVKTTPSTDLGIIPEIFRKREGVVRSLSPTTSLAAYGKDAEEFCSGHEKCKTPYAIEGPWHRLYDRKAKILFLGTTMSCNTLMHAIEEWAKVPDLFAPFVWKFTVTDYDGNTFPLEYQRHNPHHNWYFNKMEPEFLERGIAEKVKFGSADTHLVDGVKETDYMMDRLSETPMLFTIEYNEKESQSKE